MHRLLADDRSIERIVHAAEPERDVDLVDRGEVSGVGAAIVAIADAIGLEVRADVEEEAIDVQLPAENVIESKHIAKRGFGLVKEIRRNPARYADVRDAAQRVGGAVVREHAEGIEADEDVLIGQ